MELRKAKSTGENVSAAEDLQRQVAIRIQSRVEAEEQKRRRLAFKNAVARWMQIAFLLASVGGLFFAYRAGLLQRWLSGDFSVPSMAAEVNEAPESIVSDDESSKVVIKPAKVDVGRLVDQAESLFAGASVKLWKNAVPQDLPSKGGAAKAFVGLVPDANGGHSLWNLKFGGDSGFSAAKIGGEEISRAEFKRIVDSTPFLVAREGRAYVSMKGGSVRQCSVPMKDKALNPAREHLGPLYDEIIRLKTQALSFRYKVTLDLKRFSRRIDVGTFGYGQEIPHEKFVAVVRKLVDDPEACETLLSAAVIEYVVEAHE